MQPDIDTETKIEVANELHEWLTDMAEKPVSKKKGNKMIPKYSEAVTPKDFWKLWGIMSNFMCNVSTGFNWNDWEMIKISYDTAQEELEDAGYPKFCGGPNLEGEKEEVMKRIKRK